MIIPINHQKRNQKMSIISDIRDVYISIPKQDPPKTSPEPPNEDLMKQTIDHLNKTPIFTTKVK